jgi:hypothetical protein
MISRLGILLNLAVILKDVKGYNTYLKLSSTGFLQLTSASWLTDF